MTTETKAADKTEKAEKPAAPVQPELKDELVETEHSVTVNGREIAYTATAGRIVMKDEEGKAKASVFFIAYTRKDAGDPATRPLTISFNGGPGSSSVWLHLGLLGPRRVVSGDVAEPVPPPYRLVNNEFSLLDLTDLVFVDPVSTGFSRPAPGEEAKQFHSVEKDIESVGEFIRLYVTRYKRWASPKFLIGESYGTTRAAGLAGYLQQRHGMYLNGLMLISAILNFQTTEFELGNELPYVLYVPVYAATAWYHRKLDAARLKDLDATLAEAAAFASGEYAHALFKGDALTQAERNAIAARLSQLTGLTPEYIERANLRIEIMRSCKELLRNEKRTVGRLDSRFTGVDRDAVGEEFSYDPSYAAIQGPYAGAFNAYVCENLNFTSDLPYELLAGLYETWDYGKHQNKYVDVAETLRAAMTQNPFLRVFIANGYFDFATPYFATEYTVNHLHLDPALRDNIELGYYQAGHMMYVHQPSLAALRADLAAFLQQAIQAS
ncbi:MAG: peptidase S10 [Anaerolineales bacterium]|nr:peptidase S10 [Anaerolineales bacterium]